MEMPESFSRSALEMVDLPAPDGDDKTSIRPRLEIATVSVALFLLNVLHLLAELFDGRLQFEADAGQFDPETLMKLVRARADHPGR